jgi:ATP phosphoribosyltransferase regulatory subunit HisZ
LASVDTLSCALVQLTYVRESAAPLDGAALAAWADRLSATITALAEPLAVVEIDGRSRTALMRSRSPKRTGKTVAYFEIHADQHHCVTLRRFRYNEADQARAAVPFSMTLDQLETLVAELEGC